MGGLGGAEGVEAGGDGEGGAGFFEDGRISGALLALRRGRKFRASRGRS